MDHTVRFDFFKSLFLVHRLSLLQKFCPHSLVQFSFARFCENILGVCELLVFCKVSFSFCNQLRNPPLKPNLIFLFQVTVLNEIIGTRRRKIILQTFRRRRDFSEKSHALCPPLQVGLYSESQQKDYGSLMKVDYGAE